MSLNLVVNMKWQQVLVVMMVCSALLVGMVQEAQMDATATIENLVVEQNSIAFSVELQEGLNSIVFPDFRNIQQPAFVNIDKDFLDSTTIDFVIASENIEYKKSDAINLREGYLSPAITISFPAKALQEASIDDDKLLSYYIRTWSNVNIESEERNVIYKTDGYIVRFFLPEGVDTPFIDKVFIGYGDGIAGVISLNLLKQLYAPYPDAVIKIQSQVIRSEIIELPAQSSNSTDTFSNLSRLRRKGSEVFDTYKHNGVKPSSLFNIGAEQYDLITGKCSSGDKRVPTGVTRVVSLNREVI